MEASAEYYRCEIKKRCNGALAAFVEAGQLLVEAKNNLVKGQFKQLLKDLPFSKRTADRLMAIADDRRLTSIKNQKYLPTSWGTLYEITRFTDDQFKDGIRKGIVRPNVTRKEVEKFRLGEQLNYESKTSNSPVKTATLFTIKVKADCTDLAFVDEVREKLQLTVAGYSELIVVDSEWDHRNYERNTNRLMNEMQRDGLQAAKKVIRKLFKKVRSRYTRKQWNSPACPFMEKEAFKNLSDDEDKINWCLELLECPYQLHHFIADPSLARQYR